MQDDFFLFPGNDQILICFRIEGENVDTLDFVVTDKLGKEKERYPILFLYRPMLLDESKNHILILSKPLSLICCAFMPVAEAILAAIKRLDGLL